MFKEYVYAHSQCHNIWTKSLYFVKDFVQIVCTNVCVFCHYRHFFSKQSTKSDVEIFFVHSWSRSRTCGRINATRKSKILRHVLIWNFSDNTNLFQARQKVSDSRILDKVEEAIVDMNKNGPPFLTLINSQILAIRSFMCEPQIRQGGVSPLNWSDMIYCPIFKSWQTLNNLHKIAN